MIHLDCREHLPCALAEVDRLRAVNRQQAEGWQDTHRELTRARDRLAHCLDWSDDYYLRGGV